MASYIDRYSLILSELNMFDVSDDIDEQTGYHRTREFYKKAIRELERLRIQLSDAKVRNNYEKAMKIHKQLAAIIDQENDYKKEKEKETL